MCTAECQRGTPHFFDSQETLHLTTISSYFVQQKNTKIKQNNALRISDKTPFKVKQLVVSLYLGLGSIQWLNFNISHDSLIWWRWFERAAVFKYTLDKKNFNWRILQSEWEKYFFPKLHDHSVASVQTIILCFDWSFLYNGDGFRHCCIGYQTGNMANFPNGHSWYCSKKIPGAQ